MESCGCGTRFNPAAAPESRSKEINNEKRKSSWQDGRSGYAPDDGCRYGVGYGKVFYNG